MSNKTTKKLTPKQELFCLEYIIDFNATRAYKAAGYSVKSANAAGVEGFKLLRTPKIQEEIQRLMNKRAEKVEISAENVLQSILDIRDNCTQKVAFQAKNKDTDEYEDVDRIIDVNGALKANELLGKHLKLFTDKVEVAITELPKIKIIRE